MWLYACLGRPCEQHETLFPAGAPGEEGAAAASAAPMVPQIPDGRKVYSPDYMKKLAPNCVARPEGERCVL